MLIALIIVIEDSFQRIMMKRYVHNYLIIEAIFLFLHFHCYPN